MAARLWTSSCLLSILLMTSPLLIRTQRASSASTSKCTEEELARFSEEYETCHAQALQKIRTASQLPATERRDGKQELSEDEQQRMVCDGLRKSIDECTVLLGWCYTSSDVERAKEKQRALMATGLSKMFPVFNVDHCLDQHAQEELADSADPEAEAEVDHDDQVDHLGDAEAEDERPLPRRQHGHEDAGSPRSGCDVISVSSLLLVQSLVTLNWERAINLV